MQCECARRVSLSPLSRPLSYKHTQAHTRTLQAHTHFPLTLFGVTQRGTEMSFKCSHYLLLGIISLYKSLTDVSLWCVCVCVACCAVYAWLGNAT